MILLVLHVVDGLTQGRAAGSTESLAQIVAVLQLQDAPATVCEVLLQLIGANAGDDPVETLAVEIDDPEHVADRLQRILDHRLPDIALVQLGITNQRDEAPRRHIAEVALCIEVPKGRKVRRNGAKADRASREIDWIRVLGPAWVGLQTTIGSQLGQIFLRQITQQILHGVEHRRCVRLDRDSIPRLQGMEVERRHDGDHRGAGGLVSTNFQVVPLFADVVGMVDDVGAQPVYPPLYLFKRR